MKPYAIISLFVDRCNLAFTNSATGYPAVMILQRDVWIKRWTKTQRYIHTNTNSFEKGQLTKGKKPHTHTQTQCTHFQMPYPVVYCISFYSHQTNDVSLKQFVRKSGWRTQKHSSEKWCWALVNSIVFKWSAGFVQYFSFDFFFEWMIFFPLCVVILMNSIV